MKLARYWTRQTGEASGPEGVIRVVARGWSNESIDAARGAARQTARAVAQRLAQGQDQRNQYMYGDRPLPEPVLREFPGSRGPAAVVTRNGYGALVLNARELMFVDIDREDKAAARPSGGLLAGILSLFSQPAPTLPQETRLDGVAEEIRRTGERNGLSGRIYKTAAGYRALITSARYEAANPRTEKLLREFGSDPLYVRLCKMQESFRARLTPKPWRCDLPVPPVAFPFETSRDQSRMQEWEARYHSKSAAFAACRFLGQFGNGRVEPEFEDLIRLHDQETRATSGFPLA